MTNKKRSSSKKPALLLVANWDSDVGYAWWLIESYWVELAKRYHEYYSPILAYPSISKIPDKIVQAPVAVKTANFSSFSRGLFGQLMFLSRNNVTAIYFSDKPARHFAYLLFRLFGVRKIIVHDHTPGLRTLPGKWKRWAKRIVWAVPGIKADVCIGATEFVRQRFIDIACVPASRCHAVTNGIPISLPPIKSIHEHFSVSVDRKIIVTAARANRYKGGFFALDVLAELIRLGVRNWHYIYMGDGPDLASLKEHRDKLGLSEYVTFPGKIDDIRSLMQSSYMAFHPSNGEVGYSLSILEYMLCGLPVVVPDNPSVCAATSPKIDGEVYSEFDLKDAAAKIKELLLDTEKASLFGKNARSRVEQTYSLDRSHKSLLQIFDKILELNEKIS